MWCVFRTVLVGYILLAASWSPALASRASLLGRGLPPFLMLDPSGLRYFPGSAAEFDRLVLLDYSGSGYSANPFPHYANLQGGPFATLLVGDGTRFAYVLDGSTHNLLIGTAGDFGLVVGFSDRYQRWGLSQTDSSATIQRTWADSGKVSESSVRLGTSWGTRLGSGRRLEFSAGGSWFDSEMRGANRYEQDGQPPEVHDVVLESDPGWGFDVTLRTLTEGEGVSGVVQYIHEDRNPTQEGGIPSDWKRQLLAADLGWRVALDFLDDFVVGLHGAWQSSTEPSVSRYGSRFSSTEQESYHGGIFVSGEKIVSKLVIIRGGVLGSGYYDRRFTTWTEFYAQQNVYFLAMERSDYGQLVSPQFFLGAGLSWKQFQVDAQIREDISLEYPIVRWSAAMSW